MTDDPLDGADGRPGRAKRDRTARLLGVLRCSRPTATQGIRPAEIAKRTAMSPRTVYRDLRALEGELGIPVWSEGGRWGVEPADAFLPATAADAPARRWRCSSRRG